MIEIAPIRREGLRALAPGAQEFYASSKALRRFDLEKFVAFWEGLIDGPGVIFVASEEREVIGAIGALLYQDTYSGEPIVQEFFWFVRPAHRGSAGMRLYSALEGWARERGALRLHMVHLTDSMPEKLSRVYRRLGFTPVETLYSKDLAA